MEEKMLNYDLQFFGGNGAGGTSLSNGGGGSIDIVSTTDVWSYRHESGNEPFVDEINTGIRDIQNDFKDVMNTVYTVEAAKFGGADATQTLGAYGAGGLLMNQNYTNVDKMNRVYDQAVKSGFHPSRGDKSGTQAVAIHEMGHALTDHVAQKMGVAGLHEASNKIVKDAYKKSGAKGGNKAWARSISGYAATNYAECVAEAVADWYCNGSKAKSASKAIMAELKKYR